jgi:protein-tyrosine-phosphatase
VADTPEEVVVDLTSTEADNTADSGTTEEVELSPVEQKAAAEGWKPKEHWTGDPDEWRDARSFLDRGELLKKISQANKEQKEMRRVLQAMKEHNIKLSQAKAREEMQELRREKILALENNDAQRVVEIDEKILEKKDAIAEINANAKSQELDQGVQAPPEFAAWVDDNPWYATNAGMRGYADAIGQAYAQDNPGIAPSKVLAYVAREVKEKFGVGSKSVARTERPSAVLDSGTRGSPSKKTANSAIINSMSETERNIMRTLVKGGHITEDKYVEDYKKINAVQLARG